MTDEEAATIEAKVRRMAERERGRLAESRDCAHSGRYRHEGEPWRCMRCGVVVPAPEPSELDRLRAIVRELAESEPLFVFTTHSGAAAKRCALCGEVTAYYAPMEHRDNCLWLRARAEVGR